MTTTKKTTGFAIVGAGMIAEFHRQAIAANADRGARLVAIAYHNPARFADISVQFGVPCQTLAEALARPDVDAVAICTPSGQHPAQAIAAAQAGKHVLVEKPMALSLADADAMRDACRQAGVRLGVVLQSRFVPPFRNVHEAMQAGDLGELALGALVMAYHRPQAYYNQAAWRGTWALDGGGVLMNQGIHWVDQLVWDMGDPVEVQAHAATLHRKIEVEDTLAATLRFANGSMAAISATTTAAPGFPPRIEFYGTRGGIQMEGTFLARWDVADPSPAAQGRRAAKEIPWASAQQAVGAGAGGAPKGISLDGHIAVFRNFIEAVQGSGPLHIDGSEGRRSLAAVLAVYEAAGLVRR